MGRIIVEQIVSADGFAQDSDGGMRFMNASPIDNVDTGQLEMLTRVGAIVLGRVTYEMFLAYWPTVDPTDEPVADPINTLPKHVISNTIDSAPWGEHAPAIVEPGNPSDTMRRLRSDVEGDLLVWGSLQLTDMLFRDGLVDVLRLRVVPSLIGNGRGPTPTDLDPTVIRQVAIHDHSGWVTIEYEVRAAGQG